MLQAISGFSFFCEFQNTNLMPAQNGRSVFPCISKIHLDFLDIRVYNISKNSIIEKARSDNAKGTI